MSFGWEKILQLAGILNLKSKEKMCTLYYDVGNHHDFDVCQW